MPKSVFENFDAEEFCKGVEFLEEFDIESNEISKKYGLYVLFLISSGLRSCVTWEGLDGKYREKSAVKWNYQKNTQLKEMKLFVQNLFNVGYTLINRTAASEQQINEFDEHDEFLTFVYRGWRTLKRPEFSYVQIHGICSLIMVDRALVQINKYGHSKITTDRLLRASFALLTAEREHEADMCTHTISQRFSKSRVRGANVVHDKPNGSRAKKLQIQEIWASGKYDNKDLCAEQECAALNMSFSAARKHLRNLPKPT